MIVWMIIPLILFGIIGIEQSFADGEYSHEFDLENCEGILDVEEVKSAINRIEEITVNSRSLTAVDEQPNLLSMCDSTFESQGKSISMTIVVMESSEAASSLYQQNLDAFSEQGMDFREYVTFWNNFDVTINDQNVGSFMISQYDKFFINIHTSFEGEGPALIDADEIRMLSTIVQKKILDLENVSISPPNPLPDNDTGPTTDETKEQHGMMKGNMMGENMMGNHHMAYKEMCGPGFASLDGMCVLDDRCGPGAYTGKVCIMDGMMKQYLRPLHQKHAGISVDNIICAEGKQVMFKHHDSAPACVNSTSIEKLQYRGWQTEKPVMACTMEYDPICGVDGVTYGNMCGLKTQHMAMSHHGECSVS